MTLMKGIKSVVTEKHLFDKGDKCFLKTTFWKLWLIKILMQGAKSKTFQSNPPLQE